MARVSSIFAPALFSLSVIFFSLPGAAAVWQFSNMPAARTKAERTNIVAYGFKNTVEFHDSGVDCPTIEQRVKEMLLDDLSHDHFYQAWLLNCAAQDGAAVYVILSLAFEPKSDADREDFRQYLGVHEGRDFFGTPVHLEPIVGVLDLIRIKALIWDKDSDQTGVSSLLNESRDERLMARSLRDAWDVDFDIYDAWSQDGFDPELTLKFIDKYFGRGLHDVYRDDLFKRANRLIFAMRKTIVLRDGQYFDVGFDISYYEVIPQNEGVGSLSRR